MTPPITAHGIRLGFAKVSVILLCLVSTVSGAFSVNRLNGGGSIVYVDFSIPGEVVPLELIRTYNSITAVHEAKAWIGAFGWGWTTDFETILTTTPDRNVLLRDGLTGNTIVFAPEKENPAVREQFFEKVKAAYFERKLRKKPSAAELKKLELPDTMLGRLKTEPAYRLEVAAAYNIKGEIPKGELLVSTKFGYETVQFKNNQWVREKDGVIQIFDNEGRLVRQQDRSGYYMEYRYDPKNKMQLQEILSRDRTASLKLTWSNGRVAEIADNKGKKSYYTYDRTGNLVKAVDSKGNRYVYVYGDKRFPHLITSIEYPDESQGGKKVERSIRYNENGLVVYHKDKDGEEIRFEYGKKPNDPENSFWTKTKYVKKRSVTDPDERYEEFYLKARRDGTKYLYKQEARSIYQVGSKRKTSTEVTLFTECCGKPSQVVVDGQVTKFSYYPNGLLKEKIGPREEVRLEYEPKWMKVSRVVQNGKATTYSYDSRGNLVLGKTDGNQTVSLKYDRFGRIMHMTDSKGNEIKFEYGELGKPIVIEQRGVGTIRIKYGPGGRIRETETVLASGKRARKPTAAESQKIVTKVMTAFQNLLDIIRPAAQVNKAMPLAVKTGE